MNQQNYKAIAKIIKDNWNVDGRKLGYKTKYSLIMNKLGDYFERESSTGTVGKALEYNREQFLKDCGIS